MKKFEISSSDFNIPQEAKEHLTDEELDEQMEMFASTYDEGIEPDQYVSKQEVSKELEKKISRFNAKMAKTAMRTVEMLS